MCEQYSITTNRQAMIQVADAMGFGLDDAYGLLLLVLFSVVVLFLRNDGDSIGWGPARLGLPTPEKHLKPGARVNPGTANVRHPHYGHWQRWMGPEHRCAIPATSFIEHNSADETYAPVEFAFGPGKPLFFFAGIWTRWTGIRKIREGLRDMDLFGILTTSANAEIRAVHDTMPVILLDRQEVEAWLTAPEREALQRFHHPLPDGSLQIIGNASAPVPGLSS